MKVKTSELIGDVLDCAVAKCEGLNIELIYWQTNGPHYSTNWAQGGPIIEREGLETRVHAVHNGVIVSWACEKEWLTGTFELGALGPTPLIAAMRCYVTSKLGDEVEIPDELIGE